MEKASARKALVKELRTYARQVRVTQARDDSGRAKVEAMYRKIIAKASVEVKRLVEEKFKAYTETFQTEVAGAFRLRGKSFLLLYSWDFFGKPLPDGTPASRDSAELWRLGQTWEEDRVKSLRVNENISTLERSLHSNTPDRVHFHWKVNLKDSVNQVGTAGFQFHGVKPDVRATTVAVRSDTQKARGASFQEASDRREQTNSRPLRPQAAPRAGV